MKKKVPPLKTDRQAGAFLAQDLSGLDVSQFKPAKFEFEKQPMTMKNPPHPGLVVLQECIEPSGLTITQAAEALGVTRNTLSELVNGKRGISPEMAVRLTKVFGAAFHKG